MLQLPERVQKNAIALLTKAIHPSQTFEVVNQIILELDQLKPIKKRKKKET